MNTIKIIIKNIESHHNSKRADRVIRSYQYFMLFYSYSMDFKRVEMQAFFYIAPIATAFARFL